MLKSDLISGYGTKEAGYGETITYGLSVRNIGDESGHILPTIWYQGELEQIGTAGEEKWILPGASSTWELSLVMPSHDIDVYGASFHWDTALQEWIYDDQELITHVTLTGIVIEEKPSPKFVSFAINDQVVAGEQGRAVAGIRNDGTGWAFCRPLIFWSLGGEDYEAAPANWGLNPGESHTFDIYFTMPDATIQVMAVAQWWDFAARTWWATDEKGPFTVAVIGDPWPHLSIPSVVVSFMGFFNWPKGSWEPVDIPLVDIPPFDIMIGDWVLAGLQYPVDWLNWTIQKAKWIWGIASTAWDTAIEAWNNADSALEGLLAVPAAFVSSFWGVLWPDVWGLILGVSNGVISWAFDHFRGIWDRLNALEGIELSFDGILAFVAEHLGEIEPFKTLFDTFNAVYQFMADVGDEAWAFFSNPADWIFGKIDDWLNEEGE